MIKVVLPELGSEVNEATISYWHFEEGNKVNKDEDLVEMVTDKATFNIPVPCSGTLSKIYFEEGDTVKVGEVIAIIEEEFDDVDN
ncbi:MAG: biotin/lipoyl-binding protein [Candidatus Omnitrophica bacterium]|nr:biotin/lipoyl-binding protein [Candidatus Omnitrophota bacterium]